MGSVEMDWRRARDLPHSSAPRFSGALRARGTRDAGTLRPTPAPRRQWTVPIRAQSGVPLRRVHDRRTGAFPRQHARAGLRGRRGTRLPPLRGPLRTTTTAPAASTTTHAPTTTTTQGEVIQCCVPSSPMGPIDTCMLLTDSQCRTQEGLNAGPGSCSPNPCVRCCVRSSPGGAFDCIHVSSEMACTDQGGLAAGPGNCSPSPCPTTTAPGATTTTTTGAAPTSTTSTATTRPPTTTTTLLTCSGVFPRCGGSCPVGKHCRPFGRTKSCVCR